MTRARLLRLAERRARLTERARAEREALAALVARGDGAAGWIEGARRVLETLRRQPLLVAGVFALLAVLRPKRAFKLAAGGWSLWRAYRKLRRWWAHLSADADAPSGAGA
jgi:hypothetical protein